MKILILLACLICLSCNQRDTNSNENQGTPSQEIVQNNSMVHFILNDGFKKGENVVLYLKNSKGKKKIYSGKLDRLDQMGPANVFSTEVPRNEVNTFELNALDRKKNVSYRIRLEKTPVASIIINISEIGFQVIFSDRLGRYN